MKTIVVNGANGYVASNFINKLLRQNYKVIALVRANKKNTPMERMTNVLQDLNDQKQVNTDNLSVYSYSLLEKDFAIPQPDLKTIFGQDVDYFHFAASLKYDEKSVDEIFGTNIDGVKNSIDVFQQYASANSRFMHISTAYSCGKFKGLFEEKFYDNEPIDAFRNYYEQSKRFAENIVRKQMEEHGLKAHVIRLSQVVGDSETGITKTDYGIFDFSKRMLRLAYRNPGETARAKLEPASTQNLIPVNIVVRHLMEMVRRPELPTIINLVSSNPTKNNLIIDVLNEMLPMQIVPITELEKSEMTTLERLISIGMSFTGSYADTNLKFETTNRDSILNLPIEVYNPQAIANMLQCFINEIESKKKELVA